MDEVRQLNSREFIINGWCFNFLKMRATKVAEDPHNGIWCINLVYLPELGIVTSQGKEREALQGISTSNYGSWDWSKLYSFFVPPEDRYNKMIDGAYQTYLLEKAIKEAL